MVSLSTRYRHLGKSPLKLPLPLDMEPMLSAISETGIPKGDGWEYEPKWDGFRTLVFRDGEEVALASRGGRPMTRYFPEVLPAFRKLREPKLVLDGELVVVGANGLDFGALQQRVHPAESRVRMLSEAPRRGSSPSTSWPRATRISGSCRWASAASGSRSCSRARS